MLNEEFRDGRSHRFLAWDYTDVEFGVTSIRDNVNLCASADPSGTESRLAENGIRLNGTNLEKSLMQNFQSIRHAVNCVDAGFRERGMHGSSAGLDFYPGRSFLCVDHVEAGRFANDREVGHMADGTRLGAQLFELFI